MTNSKKDQHLGLHTAANWLLPAPDVNLATWPVVACDQFTSEPDYWEKVTAAIDRRPSTGHLIYPEVYLERESQAEARSRLANIHAVMQQYRRLHVFKNWPAGLFVLFRRTSSGAVRRGLVTCIDLEAYDYRPGTKALIRASEATVESRIPPRLAVRQGADLETSHVLLLVDDPGLEIMGPLYDAAATVENGKIKATGRFREAYCTELMSAAGAINGFFVPAEDPAVADWLDRLAQAPSYRNYNLLFAVGDGNHSLATAKTCWEQIKTTYRDCGRSDDLINHPARYAMVEIEALTDPGLTFEPIHQIFFNVDGEAFKQDALDFFAADLKIETEPDTKAFQAAQKAVNHPDEKAQWVTFPVIFCGQKELWQLRTPPHELLLTCLRRFLDQRAAEHGEETDYIHGDDSLESLCRQESSVGFFLPPLAADSFFEQIARGGSLPRKTFSLGLALDKRFYMECRRITLDQPTEKCDPELKSNCHQATKKGERTSIFK